VAAEVAVVGCSDAILASCAEEALDLQRHYAAPATGSRSCHPGSTTPSSRPVTGTGPCRARLVVARADQRRGGPPRRQAPGPAVRRPHPAAQGARRRGRGARRARPTRRRARRRRRAERRDGPAELARSSS
jgi:hypothetical protein